MGRDFSRYYASEAAIFPKGTDLLLEIGSARSSCLYVLPINRVAMSTYLASGGLPTLF